MILTLVGQKICALCRVHVNDMHVSLNVAQFMDLRTRYTALVTLMTQYVKFASETLKRTEDEEVRDPYSQYFPLSFLHLQLLQDILDFWG